MKSIFERFVAAMNELSSPHDLYLMPESKASKKVFSIMQEAHTYYRENRNNLTSDDNYYYGLMDV